MTSRAERKAAREAQQYQDALDRYYKLAMDNFNGVLSPRQEPSKMAEIRLAFGGVGSVGFADLAPEQQKSLLDCGAIIIAGAQEFLEPLPPEDTR
jgi:hypothetical protein